MKKFDKTKSVDWSNLSEEEFSRVGTDFNSTASIGAAVLLRHVLSQGHGYLSEMHVEGTVKYDKNDENGLRYFLHLEKLGGRLLYKWVGISGSHCLLLWDHGIVYLYTNGSYVEASALSQDEQFVRDLQETLSKDFLPSVQRGHIFAIVRRGSQLALNSLGDASIPLVASNYTPKVIEDYRFVIKDLQANSPSGRIVILEGTAGTGKTHLIRAMLMEVPDAMFVLVSPEMVPSLEGPELLPLLMTNKQSHALHGPIVLVLEDADRCLVARDKENMNSIQSLLNLGDGILGSLLDLRIIATTNAKKLDMEAAILRPGRLSKRLEVGPLDFITAHNVFRRLLPEAKLPISLDKFNSDVSGFQMTLAEVYAAARQAGWQPELREVTEDTDDLD